MATCKQHGQDWTAVLRRQPARITEGGAEGPYTDAFEIICRECGDDPGLEYRDVPPRLRRIRGPYPLREGVAAYNQHLRLHKPAAPAADASPRRCTWVGSAARTPDDWS